MTRERTGRWEAGLAVGLVVGALGVLLGDVSVLLASSVGFAYAAYGYATRVPRLIVEFDRDLSDDSPAPGGTVTVTLTVENVGDAALPDLRVVDGVPATLSVADGSPRFSASLQPGESATHSYEVTAARGHHEFDAATVECHNVSGSAIARERLATGTTLSVHAPVETFPLADAGGEATGQVPTDVGGEGVEFYGVRQYRPGDPPQRIDWRRYARTGTLRTVEYRESRAATVIPVVDTREGMRRARADGEPDGIALSKYAAARVADARLAKNDRVGVALFGDTDGYVSPGCGDEQSHRIREYLGDGVEAVAGDAGRALATDGGPNNPWGDRGSDRGRTGRERSPGDPGRSSWNRSGARDLYDDGEDEPPDRRRDASADIGISGVDWSLDTLRTHLPDGSKVVWLTPLLDDRAAAVVRDLSAHGFRTTVLSPDVTGDSPGGRLARVDREHRAARLREHGIRVVDWSPDEPVEVAIERAWRRWSG